MPSITITITADQWERLQPAIQKHREEQEFPDETDMALARRWILNHAKSEVWTHELRTTGSDNAVPDFTMGVD